MKKILVLLICLLTLTSCSEKVRYDYDIQSYPCNMYVYQGIIEDSCFEQIKITEVEKVLDNGGSGVFYLGYVDCEYCQSMVRYLNEVALDLGVTVYYIDAFDKEESYFDHQDMFKERFADYLNKEDGKTIVLTPYVFTIVNGKIKDAQISSANWNIENPSFDQIKELKDIYQKMLKPFSVVK